MWKQTNKVKISVIVPVYNAENYLDQMIESVLEQQFGDWEMLLIECGSEDGSLRVCKTYEKAYSNIHVLEKEHKGPGYARNIGLKHAKGEYILFVDADDYLSYSRLFADFIKIAEKTDADITVCNYERLWEEKLLPATQTTEFTQFSRDSKEFRFRGFFSVGTLSYVWGKLYRRTFLEEHELKFSDYEYAEDKLFNLQCYLCGAKYTFIQEKGYVYRKNANSISHQYRENTSKCWLGISYELKNWIEDRNNGVITEKNRRLIDYIIFFAVFFDSKMEYVEHKRSIWAVRRVLRIYGKDSLSKQCFERLMKAKRNSMPDQLLWRIMIRGFSFGMMIKGYLLLAIGIKILIEHRVDERLSDTGLRK